MATSQPAARQKRIDSMARDIVVSRSRTEPGFTPAKLVGEAYELAEAFENEAERRRRQPAPATNAGPTEDNTISDTEQPNAATTAAA
jgi:hypothetical protein